jgi:Cof subfamily protein (haloacid dehalogenase superfamily)
LSDTEPAAKRSRPERISFVLSDVDGTLVTDDKRVTPASQAAVARLKQQGIGFSVTSSRPPFGMRHIVDALGITDPIGGFNGGTMVRPDMSVIEQTLIPEEAARIAIDLLRSERISTWFFTASQWLITDPDGPHVEHELRTILTEPTVVADFAPYLAQGGKIVGASDDHEHLAAVEQALAEALHGLTRSGRSQLYYLDVTPPHVDKGTVVAFIGRSMGIPASEIVAIGDMDNDIPMFRKAGYAIAVGNGSDAAKAAADIVMAEGNEADGFAAAVNWLLDG